eukprot:1751812-Prymnesium_polylepis.1
MGRGGGGARGALAHRAPHFKRDSAPVCPQGDLRRRVGFWKPRRTHLGRTRTPRPHPHTSAAPAHLGRTRTHLGRTRTPRLHPHTSAAPAHLGRTRTPRPH